MFQEKRFPIRLRTIVKNRGLIEMIEPEFSFCFCGGEFERINEKTWECNKCGLVIFQKEG